MTIEDDPEHKQALCEQADYWGMESLTETEQCIVNGFPYDQKENENAS